MWIRLCTLCIFAFHSCLALDLEGQCDCSMGFQLPKAGMELFCQADFVLEIFVRNKKFDNNATVTYKILILETFKLDKKVKRANRDIMIHPLVANGIPCRYLQNRKSYIVSGKIEKGLMKLEGCRYTIESRDMSCNEFNHLRGNVQGIGSFAEGCKPGGCAVVGCKEDEDCNAAKTKDNCVAKFLHYLCFRDYGTCIRSTEGEPCEWKTELPSVLPRACDNIQFFPFAPQT